jgi:hypothetical protein
MDVRRREENKFLKISENICENPNGRKRKPNKLE